MVTRLFQSILREQVPADQFARAQKQAAAASNRVSQTVRREEAHAAAERKRKEPTLFD